MDAHHSTSHHSDDNGPAGDEHNQCCVHHCPLRLQIYETRAMTVVSSRPIPQILVNILRAVCQKLQDSDETHWLRCSINVRLFSGILLSISHACSFPICSIHHSKILCILSWSGMSCVSSIHFRHSEDLLSLHPDRKPKWRVDRATSFSSSCLRSY